MLEHLTGDVQRQVLGIHQALDKAVAVRQQVGAFLHDEHAAGVELQPLFVLPGVVVHGSGLGDEQQGRVSGGALGGGADHLQGLLPVVEFFLVEGPQLLVADFGTGLLPDGGHAVEGFGLEYGLVLRVLAVHAGALFHLGVLHFHENGIADVVGILLHQLLHPELIQELAVPLVLGVGLQVQGDGGPVALFGAGGDLVAGKALGLPVPGLLRAEGPGVHRDTLAHHEGGVEPYAELADDVHVLLLFRLLLELEGTAAGDDAQVLVQLFLGHADAVIGDGNGAGLLVHLQADGEILPGKAGGAVLQRAVIQLVNGVAGVGDQLPEKDLLVGVNGVDHQVQQTF